MQFFAIIVFHLYHFSKRLMENLPKHLKFCISMTDGMKGIYYSTTFVNYDITSHTQNRLTFDLGDILTNNIFEHDGFNFIIVFCFELKQKF